MTVVFVGGSRHVARLSAEVCRRLDRIVEQNFRVVVGDANGADRAVQAYLQACHYRQVEVFCSGNTTRNNVGNWPVRNVAVAKPSKRDRAFYTAKDREMTVEANFGLMIWDGKSTGTLMNIVRLIQQKKKAVLYITKQEKFVEFLGADGDMLTLRSLCPPELRDELDAEFTPLPTDAPQIPLISETSSPDVEPRKKRARRRSAAFSRNAST